MDKVNQYLKTLKFKKARFGGCDEEDVLKSIEQICRLYDEELKQKEEHLKTKSKLIEELQVTISDEENKDREIRELKEMLRKKEREALSSRQDSEKIMEMLGSMGGLREGILQKAEAEAEKIRRQAEMEGLKIQRAARQEWSEKQERLTELEKKKEEVMREIQLICSFCHSTERMIMELKEATKEPEGKRVLSDVTIHHAEPET